MSKQTACSRARVSSKARACKGFAMGGRGTDCAGVTSAATGLGLFWVFWVCEVVFGRRRGGRQSSSRVSIATAVLAMFCEGGAFCVKMKERYWVDGLIRWINRVNDNRESVKNGCLVKTAWRNL